MNVTSNTSHRPPGRKSIVDTMAAFIRLGWREQAT